MESCQTAVIFWTSVTAHAVSAQKSEVNEAICLASCTRVCIAPRCPEPRRICAPNSVHYCTRLTIGFSYDHITTTLETGEELDLLPLDRLKQVRWHGCLGGDPFGKVRHDSLRCNAARIKWSFNTFKALSSRMFSELGTLYIELFGLIF